MAALGRRGESLRLLETWRADGSLARARDLAGTLAGRLSVSWSGSTLVCPPVADPEGARAALREAGIRASVCGTAVRFSTHVWNDLDDIERAVEALKAVT